MRARLPQSSRLLRLGLVQPQRKHECRLAPGRDPGAVLVSSYGLHSVRIDGRGCTAGLVAAHEPAAVLSATARRGIARPYRSSGAAASSVRLLLWQSSRSPCAILVRVRGT